MFTCKTGFVIMIAVLKEHIKTCKYIVKMTIKIRNRYESAEKKKLMTQFLMTIFDE
jgi:hypothetical protein